MGFFGKVFVIAAVAIAVFMVWRWLTRSDSEAKQARHDAARRHMEGERQAKRDAKGEKVPFWRRARTPDARQPATVPVEDMVACGVCGSFVSATTPRCSRNDCPRS
jgi:hypothetical protein